MRRFAAPLAALALIACRTEPLLQPYGQWRGDLAALGDGAAPPLDGAVPPDLAPPPDLVAPRDFTVPGDFAGVIFPAPHTPLPQVLDEGGPRLKAPRITSVTFANDAIAAQIDAFVAALPASAYFHDTTAEYGIAGAVAAAPVHVAQPAPKMVDDSDIQSWLASMLDGTHPEFGKPDANSATRACRARRTRSTSTRRPS